MVVVDSSALIPLAWVGRLDLVTAVFDDVATTDGVVEEVLVDGKQGTAALDRFLDDVTVHERPDRAEVIATQEGIAVTDGAVVLLAEDHADVLLANDRGLTEVARTHGIECWWIPTLLLKCAKEEVIDAETASDLLYELVNEGMNLTPQVYTQIQRKLEDLGAE